MSAKDVELLSDWPWDRVGYSPIVNAAGMVIGCAIISLMTAEEIKVKYPDAKIPNGVRA